MRTIGWVGKWKGTERRFTRREEDVIDGVVAGQRYREIAQSHSITVGTVRWTVNEIKEKLPPEYKEMPAQMAVFFWALRHPPS